MGLSVNLELTDEQLAHFQLIMEQARNNVSHIAPEDIVASAEALIETLRVADAPGFVGERIQLLELMISMISDIDWRLPKEDKDRVFTALTYFAEPEDLIPDSIPGIGYLDDAIMIELAARELGHELEAYQDFCDFRRDRREADAASSASREDWLAARRSELQDRMHRRRRKGLPGKVARRLFAPRSGQGHGQ